jgi:TPP-dependent pyruvate/acetoin dehydrogenase alpha subunit
LPENPLLPHRKLRELHALMLRCRDLERKRKLPLPGTREALLAATAIHLLPGDLINAAFGDTTPGHLAAAAKDHHLTGELALPASASRFAMCAAVARGLQAAAPQHESGLLLAFTHAGATEPGWEAALEFAQTHQLPLLLVCTDSTGGKPARKLQRGESGLDWVSISRLSHRTKLPVVSVDGEDAVAIYRVMQECVIRTRVIGGPAVLWGITSASSTPLPRSQQPIVRLRNYMAARNIALK